MINMTLDHSFYSDPNFENWKFLRDCLPNELFPYEEVKHPDSLCRFIALENFTLEFSHVTDGKSFFQGLSFLTESCIFELEEKIPTDIKNKFGITASHKNRDWEKDLDENGDLPKLKKGDPRIRPGWGSLSPEMGAIHPDLYLWVGQYVLDKNEKPRTKKKWQNGKLRLTHVFMNPEIIVNPFFKILAKNTSDVEFIGSKNNDKPIEKLVVKISKEYFSCLALSEMNNIKVLRSISRDQYDIEFIQK